MSSPTRAAIGRRRRSRAKRTEGPGVPPHLARQYETGPFPALQAPAPHPELLALVQYRLSITITAEQWAELERIRAFVGYEGPEMTRHLRMEQHLCQGPEQEVPARPKTPKPKPTPTGADDIGDW